MAEDNKRLLILGSKSGGGGGAATWGQITGTLSDQTDLKDALDAKADSSSIPTATSDLTNDSGYITLSDVPAQVQADWNQSDNTQVDFIKNKPTIPTVDVTAAGDNTFTGNNTFTNTVSVGGTDIEDGSISGYDQQAGSGFTLSGTNLAFIVPDLGMEDSFLIMLDDSTGQVTLYVGNSNGLEITGSPVTVNGNQVATTDMLPSGTNDGTNWTSLTINSDTYAIPSGGGGSQWFGTQIQFDNLGTYDEDTDYFISDKIDYNTDIKNKPYLSSYATKTEVNTKNTQQDTEIAGKLSGVFMTQQEFDALGNNVPEVQNYFIEGSTVQMVVTFTDQSTATYNVVVD